MAEVCELVPSQRGSPKLAVQGYLMCKDKCRNDLYYWCCESRKSLNCAGYAKTILVNEQHMLRSTKDHNHAPDNTRKDVSVAVHNLKRRATDTKESPAQLVQSECNDVPGPSQASLPNKQALLQVVARTRRKNVSAQHNSLENTDVPLDLRTKVFVFGSELYSTDTDRHNVRDCEGGSLNEMSVINFSCDEKMTSK